MINPIRQAIVDVMESIPDIGVVHNRNRYATDTNALKKLYFSPDHDQIRGWFVSRIGPVDEFGFHQFDSVEASVWLIRGFLGWSDDNASELVFENLLESIRDTFRNNQDLNGTVDSTIRPNANSPGCISIGQIGPGTFAGAVVHTADCRLTTFRNIRNV